MLGGSVASADNVIIMYSNGKDNVLHSNIQ